MLPSKEEHLTRLHEGERFKSRGARLRGGLWALALALTSCGDSDSAPPPGAGPEWKSAFADKGGRCAGDKASLDPLAKVTLGDTTLFVGFEQTGADNQDPLIARYDGDRRVYCVHHENDGPDGRAVGLTWSGGEYTYVVYTIVGGGSDLEGKQGWLGAYAPGALRGGGPKVSYVPQAHRRGWPARHVLHGLPLHHALPLQRRPEDARLRRLDPVHVAAPLRPPGRSPGRHTGPRTLARAPPCLRR